MSSYGDYTPRLNAVYEGYKTQGKGNFDPSKLTPQEKSLFTKYGTDRSKNQPIVLDPSQVEVLEGLENKYGIPKTDHLFTDYVGAPPATGQETSPTKLIRSPVQGQQTKHVLTYTDSKNNIYELEKFTLPNNSTYKKEGDQWKLYDFNHPNGTAAKTFDVMLLSPQNLVYKLKEAAQPKAAASTQAPIPSKRTASTKDVPVFGMPNGNPPNKCWFNASIQCIFRNPELTALILKDDLAPRAGETPDKLALRKELKKFLTKVMENQTPTSDYKRALYDIALRSSYPTEAVGRQQDPAAFVTTVMACYATTVTLSRTKYVGGVAKPPTQEQAALTPAMTSFFPPDKNGNDVLKESLESIIRIPERQGFRQDGSYSHAPEILTFSSVPPGNQVKPQNISDLKTYATFKPPADFFANKEEAAYELTGFTVHCGTSFGGGHYVNYAKNNEGQWYLYNDGHEPIKVTERQALACRPDQSDNSSLSAYGRYTPSTLFYKKVSS